MTVENEGPASKVKGAASVLLCYAPDCAQDRALLDRLMVHLALLHREGKIRAWHDGMMVPGDEHQAEIGKRLEEAQLILLLVSASFVASDTCYERLAVRAMQRRAAGEARVIPIVLRPCEWQSAPFGALAALPAGGRAIAQFEDVDAAFTEVARGIRAALDRRAEPTEPACLGIVTTPRDPLAWQPSTLIKILVAVALAGVGLAVEVVGSHFGGTFPWQTPVAEQPTAPGSALPSPSVAPTALSSASSPSSDSTSVSLSPLPMPAAPGTDQPPPAATIPVTHVIGAKP